MHELGITEDIMRKALEAAKQKGLKKVTKLKVLVGETLLSDADEVREIFKMITSGTVLADADFNIEISKLKVRCANCNRDYAEKTLRLDCPSCGSANMQVVSGKEIEITQID